MVRILSRPYHKQSLTAGFSQKKWKQVHKQVGWRDVALSASNSTQGSIKSNDSSGSVTKSESVGGTENGRTRLLVVG